MNCRFALALLVACLGVTSNSNAQPADAQSSDVLHTSQLLANVETLTFDVARKSDAVTVTPSETSDSAEIIFQSENSVEIVLEPVGDQLTWDFSRFSNFRMEFENRGAGLVWIRGRIESKDEALDYRDSAMSQAFLLPSEHGTLGIAFQRSEELYDGPEIFEGQSGKPNGHRDHWKTFDPDHVLRLRLTISSDIEDVDVVLREMGVGFPFGPKKNVALEALPYLDQWGQVKNLNWPGKLNAGSELQTRAAIEAIDLAEAPNPAHFNQWGGWEDGPQLKSTGFFRTEKHNGKWWLVDPSGKLFWSHGVCSTGFDDSTPYTPSRENLFESVPAPDSPSAADVFPARDSGDKVVSMHASNMRKKFGEDWRRPASDQLHQRFRAWGLNTLGAWSDDLLLLQRRTPYTPVIHLWGPFLDEDKHCPNAFSPYFVSNLKSAIESHKEQFGEDPWCIGMFLDNEVHWKEDIVELAFSHTTDHSAKQTFTKLLKTRYATIAELNQKWKTTFASWDDFETGEHIWEDDEDRAEDYDWLVQHHANEYYRQCREQFKSIFPNHLYLGSRIHTCQATVAKEAAKFVDVYSINHYMFTVGLGTLPPEIDIPIMVTEFHFGAIDRGVMGASLAPVANQKQRGRAYANYVASALAHPQFVGTHWFAYLDQSPVGRPGENYNIGLVDVTDTPYSEITGELKLLGAKMYQARFGEEKNQLRILRKFLKPKN